MLNGLGGGRGGLRADGVILRPSLWVGHYSRQRPHWASPVPSATRGSAALSHAYRSSDVIHVGVLQMRQPPSDVLPTVRLRADRRGVRIDDPPGLSATRRDPHRKSGVAGSEGLRVRTKQQQKGQRSPPGSHTGVFQRRSPREASGEESKCCDRQKFFALWATKPWVSEPH